jgi:hypothetical protein
VGNFWSVFGLSFPGPDYIKDHLPKIHQHTWYIGEKRPVLEKTGDLRYLWRPASHASLPARYKNEYVGEVGWGMQEYSFFNTSRLHSGFGTKVLLLNLCSSWPIVFWLEFIEFASIVNVRCLVPLWETMGFEFWEGKIGEEVYLLPQPPL